MADKIMKMNLERDFSRYLYFVDGAGNVCRRPKHCAEGYQYEVLVAKAIVRDPAYLYFIDKEGDVSRCARAVRPTSKAGSR